LLLLLGSLLHDNLARVRKPLFLIYPLCRCADTALSIGGPTSG
jgi:hypothetical protein